MNTIHIGTSQTSAYMAGVSGVQSLNGLSGAVTLATGANVTITPSGNTLTIASTAGDGAGVSSMTGNSDITATTVNGAVTLGDTATSADTPSTMLNAECQPKIFEIFRAADVILLACQTFRFGNTSIAVDINYLARHVLET